MKRSDLKQNNILGENKRDPIGAFRTKLLYIFLDSDQ